MLIPLSFVYVPELLFQGEIHRIILVAISYAFGYATLAVGIQGRDYFFGTINNFTRLLFFISSVCFLLPLIYWLKLLGIVILILAYVLAKSANKNSEVSLH